MSDKQIGEVKKIMQMLDGCVEINTKSDKEFEVLRKDFEGARNRLLTKAVEEFNNEGTWRAYCCFVDLAASWTGRSLNFN